MKTGIEFIAEERKRQIEVEGYTYENDDKQNLGQLATAALCYAIPPYLRKRNQITFAIFWNWDIKFWKPTPDDRIKELAKAGALIAAEIDRLQRLNNK